jgi:hypothetical protein
MNMTALVAIDPYIKNNNARVQTFATATQPIETHTTTKTPQKRKQSTHTVNGFDM